MSSEWYKRLVKVCKKRFWKNSAICCKRDQVRKMTKEEGKKLVDEYHAKKPKSLEYFLKIMDMTEEEFMNIALKHEISPWNYSEKKVIHGKKLHDQDNWDTTPIRKKNNS